MRCVHLGNTGLQVSALSLGTMTFGRESSEEESRRMFNRYLEAGGNFIDTANVYSNGVSEEILGRLLEDHREKVVLATKAFFRMEEGPYGAGASRKALMRAVEESLRRLRTGYIDLYQIHCWDLSTPIDETMDTLRRLIEQGKVRYAGCSNFTGWQIVQSQRAAAFSGWEGFVSAQMQYSLIERGVEYEVLPACLDEGLSLLAWGPLGGGFLTGKYRSGEQPAEGRIARATEDQEEAWSKRATKRNFAVLSAMEKVAKKRGCSISQVAINWLLCQEGVIPIVGARTLEQLEDNLGAEGWVLTDDEFERLSRAGSMENLYPYRFIEWANNRVWGK